MSHSCKISQQHPLHVHTLLKAKNFFLNLIIFWANGPLKADELPESESHSSLTAPAIAVARVKAENIFVTLKSHLGKISWKGKIYVGLKQGQY